MSNRRIKASLLSLPDELLSAIFSAVARDLDGIPDPRAVVFVSTCRRLAPIVRQEVYRKLWIGHSSTETRLLSELCAKRPDLRALVQDLHCVRTMEIDHHGYGAYIDFGADHPGNVLLRSYFPALHTLSVVEATPADIFNILSRVSATTPPAIRKLILGCVSDPQLDDDSEHRETWWHLLARLPMLEDLTFFASSLEFGPVRIVFKDARALAALRNLHLLALDDSPWHPAGGTTLAALFPNLKGLRLQCNSSAELEALLRHAPRSLTQLDLWLAWEQITPLRSEALARFPLLERLGLCRVDATALLPSMRTSRIKHLRLSPGAELADQELRSLVDGPARMKHLKALELDYVSSDLDCWSERDLRDALGRDEQYDLAQVKAAMHPEWPQGCSAEGLRTVMDAAGKNGIKVYGTAVDCLDWNDRFDEQVERYLVDDALASNDYTTIERYLGGRPRLPSPTISPPSRRRPNRSRLQDGVDQRADGAVVAQAPAKSLPALLPTCRRLARIARNRLYAEIAYGGEDGPYDKLVALMDTQLHLRELVKCLSIARVYPRDPWRAPDSRPYPGTARILAHFPTLKALCVVGASPDRLAEILASPPDHLLPPLEHLAVDILAVERYAVPKFPWWEALPRFPNLGRLSLYGQADSPHEDRYRVPTIPKGVHTLTMENLGVPEDGAAAFADSSALAKLTLWNSESMISRWLSIAPLGLTHATLHLDWSEKEWGGLSQQLGRFPRLQHLRLRGRFVLELLVPNLCTSNLRHLELQYCAVRYFAAELDLLLTLVHGEGRMKHLQSIHLDVDSDWFVVADEELRRVFQHTIKVPKSGGTVAQLKQHYDPFQRNNSTASDVQRLVEAARSNGIAAVGCPLKFMRWEEHFDVQLEACFVEDALATDDYTLLERQYGEEGAIRAIQRQRPRLSALLSGDGS